MIRRFLCWLGDLIGKDWHKWETISEIQSEYEPNNIYTQEYCKHCGTFVYSTRPKHCENGDLLK